MSVRINSTGGTAASHREPSRGFCSIVLATPAVLAALIALAWRKTR